MQRKNNRHSSVTSKHHRYRFAVRTRYFFNSLIKQTVLILLPVLFISIICIRYLTTETLKNASRDTYQELYQLNAKMDANFTAMDNVYIYLLNNSRVNSSLQKSFNEEEQTLDSIRRFENVTGIFSNYIYANSYISDLKIYYYNPYNRVLSMQKRGITLTSLIRDQEWISRSQNLDSASFLEGITLPATEAESEQRILRQYRKIYTSLNAKSSVGCIVFDYNLDKMDQYLHSSGLPAGQIILFSDKSGNVVYQSDEFDYSGLITSLNMDADSEGNYSDKLITLNHTTLFVSVFRSNRTDGLNYITVTPVSILLQSARSILKIFAICIIIAILFSALLAYYKTRKDFLHLNSIFDILENPEKALQNPESQKTSFRNPYDAILNNLINLFLRQNYLDVLNKAQESRIQVLELTALQEQINPHFLHNTLNTIYWESIRLTGSENQCSRMITDLSSMMRYSLGDPEQSVTISEELEYLKEFLRIQTIRFHNKFDVVFNIDEAALTYPIRRIILQPIVENAIHHGIKPKSGRGTISIDILKKEERISFRVADDGVGMSEEQLEKLRTRLASKDDYNQHIGLSNVNRRLILCYGQESALQIKSVSGKGTCIYFFIAENHPSSNGLSSSPEPDKL